MDVVILGMLWKIIIPNLVLEYDRMNKRCSFSSVHQIHCQYFQKNQRIHDDRSYKPHIFLHIPLDLTKASLICP